jgi:hypothetical protein
MQIKSKIAILATVLLSTASFSADFLLPVQGRDLTKSPSLKLECKSGAQTGRITSVTGEGAYLTAISFEGENGIKKELSSQNGVKITAEVPRTVETSMLNSRGTSANATSHTTGRAIGAGDALIWRSITTPDGEQIITQLLNPGFANFYEIYSATPELAVSQSEKYIAVSGGKSFYITKKRYSSKGFEKLFGENKHFMKKYENRKIEWRSFPEHLQLFSHYEN